MDETSANKNDWQGILTVVGSLTAIATVIWLITNCTSCH